MTRENISVPLARYCDLLLAEARLQFAEERARVMVLRLAISIEENVRLEEGNDNLTAAIFEMTADRPAPGLPDVARLELAPPVKKGFDA